MRIAMLAPRATVRGPLPKHTPLLVEALRRRGCEVELLPWGRGTEGERIPAKLYGRARDVADARRAVIRGGFPVVVVKTAHDWHTLVRDVLLLRALRAQKRVIVLQFHGSQSQRLAAPGSKLFKAATTRLLASADGLLVLSREEQVEWQAFSPRSHVLVVRNPGPPLPEEAHDETPEKDARPTILCVARLMAEKGVLDLVGALPLIHRDIPCRLTLAGDGPESAQVQALVTALGVADSVDLPGYVDGHKLGGYYRAADVFALPTYWYEGFPTVILEAMAAGLPIVTTRTRGLPDHLVEGENALFVPPRDPDVLATALSTLLDDAPLRRRMGEANRKKVREFDPDPVAAEYLFALEQIVDSAGKIR